MSVTAISAAGALTSLYLGLLFPGMSLTAAAFAGLFTAVAVMEGGYAYGILCFGAAAILGLLLFPAVPGTIFYAAFFGAYPLAKSFAERRQGRILAWAIKLAAFFIALTFLLTVLGDFVLGAIPFAGGSWPLIYGLGALAFVVYDMGFSKLIGFYLARVYKHRNRW